MRRIGFEKMLRKIAKPISGYSLNSDLKLRERAPKMAHNDSCYTVRSLLLAIFWLDVLGREWQSAPKKHVVDLNTSALLCSNIENICRHKRAHKLTPLRLRFNKTVETEYNRQSSKQQQQHAVSHIRMCTECGILLHAFAYIRIGPMCVSLSLSAWMCMRIFVFTTFYDYLRRTIWYSYTYTCIYRIYSLVLADL